MMNDSLIEMRILEAFAEVPGLRVAYPYPFAVDSSGTRVLSLKTGKWAPVAQIYPLHTDPGQNTPAVTRARLVACAFQIPNVGGVERIFFRDGDSTNCSVDNITFVYKDEDPSTTTVRGANSYRSKRCKTPLGTFKSIKEAADAHKINRVTMLKRIQNKWEGYECL